MMTSQSASPAMQTWLAAPASGASRHSAALRWLAAGAHVLVVMDSCHAASTTRDGADGIRWRGLRVSELQDLQ